MVSVKVQNMGRWSDIWYVKIPGVMTKTLLLGKIWSITVGEVGVLRVGKFTIETKALLRKICR